MMLGCMLSIAPQKSSVLFLHFEMWYGAFWDEYRESAEAILK